MLGHCILSAGNFTPDSYSFLELTKGMFAQPLRVNTIRQYQLLTSWGISFPYLYPLAVAVVNLFAGLGMYGGVLVNLVAAVASAALLYKVSMRLAGTSLPGGLAAVFLLGNFEYMNEVASARTIPPAILCGLVVLYFLSSLPALRGREAFLAGLAAGAGAVVRFDAMVTAVCALVAVVVFSGRGASPRWKNALLFAAGGLVFTLPWVVYSLAVFGTPWVSDNMGTFMLVETAVPNRYFSIGYQPATLQTEPGAWFAALFGQKLPTVLSAFVQCLTGGGGLLVLIWAAYMLVHARLQRGKGFLRGEKRLRATALALGVTCLLKTGMLVLVGYDSVRYHLESCMMLVLVLSIAAARAQGEEGENRRLYAHTALLLGLLVGVQFSAWPQRGKLPLVGEMEKSRVLDSAAASGSWDTAEAMAAVMTAEVRAPRVLFLDGGAAFRFGACTGVATFVPPVLQEDDPYALDELIQAYAHPDFVVAGELPDGLAERYGLEAVMETEAGTVYRVTLHQGW